MLQQDRVKYYFSLRHELPDVEFKGPGRRDENPLFGRVMRAAMAMANHRGGGVIILGVSEQAGGLNFEGLTPAQLATWKYEDIADGFNSHTSSYIGFEIQEYEYEGKVFLVLDIHEFTSDPILCTKNYRDNTNPHLPEKDRPIVLRAGAIYVRTSNKPESKEILSGEVLRTLIELVVDKGVEDFVTRTQRAGLTIAPQPGEKDLFEKQLEGWTSPLLEDIRSRGYWDVRIRPVTFKQDRLPLSQLRQVLIRASLNYRGWEFPYITPQMPKFGNDWIGLENQQENCLQAWRFFQSGQFAAQVGFLDDWEDRCHRSSKPDWAPGILLSALDVVFRLTEIFGLASRLAISEVYRDERSLVVDVTLCHVRGHQIHDRGALNERFPVFGYTTEAESIDHSVTLAKEDIIARPRELALEEAHYLFERFGWNPSIQLLAAMQSEIRIHA